MESELILAVEYIIIYVFPSFLADDAELGGDGGVGGEELDEVWVIAGAGIALELAEDVVVGLVLAIVAAEARRAGLETVGQGKDVDKDAVRRLGIVKVGRIAALAIVPFVVAEDDVVQLFERRIDLEIVKAELRVALDERELVVGELAVVVAYDVGHARLAEVVVARTVGKERDEARWVGLQLLGRGVATHAEDELRLIADDAFEQCDCHTHHRLGMCSGERLREKEQGLKEFLALGGDKIAMDALVGGDVGQRSDECRHAVLEAELGEQLVDLVDIAEHQLSLLVERELGGDVDAIDAVEDGRDEEREVRLRDRFAQTGDLVVVADVERLLSADHAVAQTHDGEAAAIAGAEVALLVRVLVVVADIDMLEAVVDVLIDIRCIRHIDIAQQSELMAADRLVDRLAQLGRHGLGNDGVVEVDRHLLTEGDGVGVRPESLADELSVFEQVAAGAEEDVGVGRIVRHIAAWDVMIDDVLHDGEDLGKRLAIARERGGMLGGTQTVTGDEEARHVVVAAVLACLEDVVETQEQLFGNEVIRDRHALHELCEEIVLVTVGDAVFPEARQVEVDGILVPLAEVARDLGTCQEGRDPLIARGLDEEAVVHLIVDADVGREDVGEVGIVGDGNLLVTDADDLARIMAHETLAGLGRGGKD